MLSQTLETNLKRLTNFLGFAKGYLKRHNPVKVFTQGIVQMTKEALTVSKKLKMSKYRVNYHRHQLKKMESLIAENNDHAFLKGRKINEIR